MADLTTNVAGLELANPFILASGPLSYDGAAILRAYHAGAGAVVTKTISQVPATNPIPHITQASGGLLNTEKWSDLLYERWIDHEIPYAKEGGATVIGSVGLTPADVAVLARPISGAGACALEVVSYDGSVLVSMVRKAAEEVEIPILAKVSSNWPDVVEIAVACLRNGAAGITAIDSVGPVLRINIQKRAPLLGYAWLTGQAIFPIALRIVSEIALATGGSPIVGTGGVWEVDNVLEMIMAGAHAVGICSLAVLRGVNVFSDLASELSARLDDIGHSHLRDAMGLALPHLREYQCGESPIPTVGKRVAASFSLNEEQCTKCGLCMRICPYQARLSAQEVDPSSCRLCGLCASACPTGALALDVREGER